MGREGVYDHLIHAPHPASTALSYWVGCASLMHTVVWVGSKRYAHYRLTNHAHSAVVQGKHVNAYILSSSRYAAAVVFSIFQPGIT